MPIDDALRLQAENLDLRRLLQQAGVDAAEQKTLEQLQTLLVAELHHRIQNMLAMVGAIVSQSLRTAETIEEGRQGVESRIAALSRVHDLLLQANWRSRAFERFCAPQSNHSTVLAGAAFISKFPMLRPQRRRRCHFRWRSTNYARTQRNMAHCPFQQAGSKLPPSWTNRPGNSV